jgi:hypothetical protein
LTFVEIYDKKANKQFSLGFLSASNKLKLEEDFTSKKAVYFDSHLKSFYEEFRVEFYIKIKPIESKIIYLLYAF